MVMNWQSGGAILSPITASDRAALRRYLPQSLAEHLLSAEAPTPTGDLSLALVHLASLLHTISTYLPLNLVHRRLSEPSEELVWSEFVESTLVFADISGFTAMSESLARHGREGAEVMTGVVNRIFAALLEPLSAFGGDLLQFGGDGMLSGFLGADHSLRGATAALTMQERMADFAEVHTPLGTFPLAMSISVNSGPSLFVSVGTERGADHWVTGPTVNETARVCDACPPGRVLLGEATRRQLGTRARTRPVAGFHEALELQRARPEEPLDFIVPVDLSSPDTFAVQISAFLERIEALRPYLPPGLMGKLALDPQQPSLEGEHRRVTSCFVNVLGFSQLVELFASKPAASADGGNIADLTRLLNRYFTTMQKVILHYEGVINKIDLAMEGDKLLAIFGAPLSHEDDPARAVRAALEIKEALAGVNSEVETFLAGNLPPSGQQSPGPPLTQRIGLSTGDVFTGNVGSPLRKEYTVMGDTVILAARLMEMAQPGEVYLDEPTVSHARRELVCSAPEPLRLRGKAEPIMAHRLQGHRPEAEKPGTGRNGPVTARRGEPLPLVDRSKEKTVLQQVMEGARAGQGQLIDISGAAGVGKSRLVGELAGWWIEKAGIVYSGDCRYYGSSTPYLPWLDIFQEFFDLKASDPPEDQQGKIVERVAALRPDLMEWTPLVGNYLGIPMAEVEWLESLNGELRQGRLFDILGDLLSADSLRHPILLLLENWHWADVASLRLLEYLSQRLSKQAVCICTIHRPSEELAVPSSGMQQTMLLLEELTREDSSTLINAGLRGANASKELVELIWERAQGNPLFIEEMLNTLLEAEQLVWRDQSYQLAKQPEPTTIPQTIKGLLMARLDRLGEPARDLLRLASVIGPRFSGELLGELTHFLKPIEHHRYLAELVESGVIRQEPAAEPVATSRPGESRYRFSQALLQEVIYESLPFARRRALHGQVAAALERRYAAREQLGLPPPEPEAHDQLAYHYVRSAQKAKAVEYSVKAGDKAREAYANELALSYYSQALDLLGETLASATEQRRQEHLMKRYDILAAREQVLDLFGRRDAQRADLDEMISTAESLGDLGRLSEVTNRLSLFQHSIGNYREAGQAAQAALALKRQLGDRAGEGEGLYCLASSCRHLDEMDDAQAYYEEALAVARELKDQKAECHRLNGLGVFYWQMGDLEQSQTCLEEALAVARRSDNLRGEGFSLGNLGLIYSVRGEYEWALRCFERGRQIARDIGDRLAEGAHRADLGLLYGRLGVWEKAREELGWSLVSSRRAHDRAGEASRFYRLALVNTWASDDPIALELLSRALQITRSLGERRVAGDVYHGFGLVYLSQGHYEMALNSFNQAVRLRGLSDQRGELLRDLSYIALAHLGLDERDKALHCSLTVVNLLEGEGAPQILEESPARSLPRPEQSAEKSEAGTPRQRATFRARGEEADTGPQLAQKVIVHEPQQLFANHAHLLRLLGKEDEARPYLEKAQRILMARARRIEDPQLRSSYLTNIAAHRAILEAWEDDSPQKLNAG
jgi:class 3 adenylate cyclase/tetratricopeptide (TPR) repeat protein